MVRDSASLRTNSETFPKTSLLRTIFIALGLSNIASCWMAAGLISPLHLIVYHWSGPTLALFAPVWLNVTAIWMLAVVLLYSTRWGRRWRRALWVGILVVLPALTTISFQLASNNSDQVLGMGNPNHNHFLYLWLYGLNPLLWMALLLVWRPSFERNFERLVRFAEVVLAFSGIAGFALLTQMAWMNWKAIDLNRQQTMHIQTAVQPAKPRIIWLVMDELSYQQIYEQRFPGLALPAFDRLAETSSIFTQVIPAGLYTDRIMPALMAGQPVEEIRSSAEGQLWTKGNGSRDWQPYSQYNTVFQDALRSGYSTGIVGWWNPYCRILPTVVQHCFWTAWFLEHRGFAEGASADTKLKSVVERASAELGNLLPNRAGSFLESLGPGDKLHVAGTYLELSQQADKLLQDSSANFVLIHISIPHPVGIYNRATGELTAEPTSYIDNLALSDQYLAHLRAELDSRGEWDSTTLVVMGDHGWRTQIWKEKAWNTTDEIASHGGKFDMRPAYIVKLANQQKGSRVEWPFHALETREMFNALMGGQIKTEQDLETWVSANH